MQAQSEPNVVKSTREPIAIPPTTLSQYLAQRIANHDPDMLALIYAEDRTQLTYGQLHQDIQRLANGLVQVGVVKQDLVLFLGDNSLQYAIAMLATIYLGVTFSQVTPANGPFELSRQLQDCKATVLVIDTHKVAILEQILANAEYGVALKQLKLLIVMNNNVGLKPEIVSNALIPRDNYTYDQVFAMGKDATLPQIPYFKTSLDDRYMIIYTSGTTGLPKGAMHSQYSFLTTLLNVREDAKMIGWKGVMCMPLGHISGSFFLTKYLDSGITSVLFRRNDLEETLAAVETYRIEYLIFTHQHAVHLAQKHFAYNLASLKVMLYGGSKIPDVLIQKIQHRFKIPVVNYYGATEFMASVLVNDYWNTNLAPSSVGTLVGNVEMKIISLEDGKALPKMEQGEVCFRGPQCFVGYLGNEQATKATIDSEGWFHSGDVGYYDQSGALFIVDRIKELIKYKHWSIFPAEIEDFLHRHPAVSAACVVGVKHVSDGELVRAYIQLKPTHSSTSATELIQFVQDNLGFQKRLRAGVHFVTQIPRTSVGKVERKYFKNLVKSELITDHVE